MLGSVMEMLLIRALSLVSAPSMRRLEPGPGHRTRPLGQGPLGIDHREPLRTSVPGDEGTSSAVAVAAQFGIVLEDPLDPLVVTGRPWATRASAQPTFWRPK